MPLFTRNRTNPIFYRETLDAMLRDDPERLERMRTEPDSLDLLTWNVFMSLDTHRDQDWLAYRLQVLGGPSLRAPVRISLFSGAARAPFLEPSAAYVSAISARTGADDGDRDRIEPFTRPVEVPVRIETPDVLLLVDTARTRMRAGVWGRDRLAEITDAGLEHARRLSSQLVVGLVADGGSEVLATQLPRLADRGAVARMLPWRPSVPTVGAHGVTWAELLALWNDECGDLDLGGQPLRDFREYAGRTVR